MKIHLFIFVLLSFQLFILTPMAFINKFLAVAICLGVIFYFAGKNKLLFVYKRWYEVLAFGLVNAYLTFAIFGFDLFIEPRPGKLIDLSYYETYIPATDFQALLHMASPYLGLLYFGLGFIWVCYVLLVLLDCLNIIVDFKNKVFAASPNDYWKKWFILFTISFAVLLIWLWAFNPAILTGDSGRYLNGWRFGIYNTASSPLYAFMLTIIGNISPIKPEVLMMVFMQMILFSILTAAILMYFHQRWIRFRYVAAAAIILSLIPSLALHTIVIWVILPHALAMLWLSYVLLRIMDEMIIKTVTNRQEYSLCVQLCISLVLIFFLRANSFLVYLIIVPVLVILFIVKKQWKLLISVTISILLVLLIRYPGYQTLGVYQHEQTLQHRFVAGIHDIHSTYYNDGNLSEQTLAKLKILIPNIDDPEQIEKFQPDWARYLEYDLEAVGELTTGEFMSMYMDTLFSNPGKVLSSVFYRTRPYWVIDSKGYINTISYCIDGIVRTEETIDISEFGIQRKTNFLTKLMYNYTMGTSLPLPSIFIWRYGFWVALMIICIMNLILDKRYLLILAFMPTFIYLATFYLTNAWAEYRYGLPILLTGLFLPLATFLLKPVKVME